MANTQLENKVRNPKNLNEWLDIWSAEIVDGNNYTITPSFHWVFPLNLALSTNSRNIVSYETEECLSWNQAVLNATLSWSGGNGNNSYTLSTNKDEIAVLEPEECLALKQAVTTASLVWNGNNLYSLSTTKSEIAQKVEECLVLDYQAITDMTLSVI